MIGAVARKLFGSANERRITDKRIKTTTSNYFWKGERPMEAMSVTQSLSCVHK